MASIEIKRVNAYIKLFEFKSTCTYRRFNRARAREPMASVDESTDHAGYSAVKILITDAFSDRTKLTCSSTATLSDSYLTDSDLVKTVRINTST